MINRRHLLLTWHLAKVVDGACECVDDGIAAELTWIEGLDAASASENAEHTHIQHLVEQFTISIQWNKMLC